MPSPGQIFGMQSLLIFLMLILLQRLLLDIHLYVAFHELIGQDLSGRSGSANFCNK